MAEPEPSKSLDFQNTEIAFASKTDKQLKKMNSLFKMMSSSTLTKLLSSLGLVAVKWNLPLARYAVKQTIYEQFCGGENLLDCQESIDNLYNNDVLTVLDYGAEGKSGEEDLDEVRDEFIDAIQLAAANSSVPVITVKITGLGDDEVLKKLTAGKALDNGEQHSYERMYARLDTVCQEAHEHNVGVFIDAEESWLQVAIDNLAIEMMSKYNKEEVIVYNTYQLYRHDKLAQLKADHAQSRKDGYLLGVKLVRGAYMIKERKRAEEQGYTSPIHKDKPSVDKDFDEAVTYCVKNYETIASCCASHNEKSNKLQAQLIEQLGLDKSHKHLNFCQLYGMSDHISFNLANAGYNVAKYVVYGPVKEVIPYLIRRAQENTSVTGEMGRELGLISKEVKRRGL